MLMLFINELSPSRTMVIKGCDNRDLSNHVNINVIINIRNLFPSIDFYCNNGANSNYCLIGGIILKKKVFTLVLSLSLFASGIAAASSQWGQFNGMEIVKIRVNGTEINPEIPGHIEEGSTMLPLRAVSQYLGANVQWHPDDYSVDISTPKPTLSLKQLNKIGEPVGIVYALDASGNYISQGSGFLLDGGVFVTCSHVIIANTKSLYIDVNGKTYTTSTYLFNDPETDLAAVKIDAPAAVKYTTTFPVAGEKVYSLGFPNGKFQISEGFFVKSDGQEITHTAMTYHGSSGGILVNSVGEIVGITSSGALNTESNGAIPISVALQELDKLNK
jgi:S1-C subfamily serine protease